MTGRDAILKARGPLCTQMVWSTGHSFTKHWNTPEITKTGSEENHASEHETPQSSEVSVFNTNVTPGQKHASNLLDMY